MYFVFCVLSGTAFWLRSVPFLSLPPLSPALFLRQIQLMLLSRWSYRYNRCAPWILDRHAAICEIRMGQELLLLLLLLQDIARLARRELKKLCIYTDA